MAVMMIFVPGMAVEIGPEDSPVSGKVTKVMVEGEGLAISYEVVWWSGNDRKTAWYQEFEVRRGESGDRKEVVGFHANNG